MRKYEITYLVSDEVRENDLNKVTGAVAGFIGELGGKVDKEEIWGRRKLAYPIQKADFATYVTLNFELPSEKCPEFERDMHHDSSIIRHLVIVKDYGHEEISLSKSEIAEADEITDVVGGDKSFEAIEGQTEESRDLMAKREASEDDGEEETVVELETEEKPEEKEEEVKEIETKEEEPEVEEKAEKEAVVEEKKAAPKKKTETKKAPVKTKEEKPKATKPSTSLRSGKTAKSEEGEADLSRRSEVEAERLSKLNDELDDILKDEL